MRINPYYFTTKEGIHQNYPVQYPVKKTAIVPPPTPIFDLPPNMPLGDPREQDHPKKELIRTLVINPEQREEAKKAAMLEKQSGAEERPITNALIKTTQAHQSAMSAPTVEEGVLIADETAKAITKEQRKQKRKELVKNPIITLILGALIALVIFKLLKQE